MPYIFVHMLRRFRITQALALSLLLVVTGQSMALARGMTSPTGEMVICTGSGPVVVPIDANGQPTGPAHICPDCALTELAAYLIDVPALTVPEFSHRERSWLKTADVVANHSTRPMARAPPRPV